MKKILLAFTGLIAFCLAVKAQDLAPKREFRGAWIATYFGIDWPNRNQTPQQQRDVFISIVNHHQQTGITAIYLQVRSQSDAMYPSSIEPWGFYLTPLKIDGNQPCETWDPLQFAIDECHARGMELHAWINPYRAIGNIANINYFSPTHVARQHQDWLLTNNAERVLDPGLPQVREYVKSVVEDIVNRYDVDGIHFDDYFYPNNASLNDDATFAAYNRGFTVRADWRRDNVNLLIQSVSQSVKAIKPWVEFGVSPSGIWRNGGEGSATTGLQHYVSLFADSRKWLQEGWIDYLAPQVYWYIGQTGSDYQVLIPWWNNNAYGRLIYIGMAGYKVGDPAQNANFATNRSQIPNQVRMNRNPAYPNVYGQSIYNTTSLRNNRLNFRDSLMEKFYNVPALQPLMPWIDNTTPQAATNLAASFAEGHVTLNWNNPPEATNELDKVKRLVVYRSEAPIDLTDAKNILTITATAVSSFVDESAEPNKTYFYKVTALDRLSNESDASNEVPICTFDDEEAPAIVSCTPQVAFCVTDEASYTVPAILATDNCVTLTYSYAITGATARTGSGNDASGHFAIGVSTISWTIQDAAGNTSTCETKVTVNTNPVVTIPDAFVLPSGVLANTVYTGYLPASSITLTAAINGNAPYSYSWSNGSTASTATVSPESTTTYLLTVTDANGCQAVASKDIAVVDISAGKNNNKVSICHRSSDPVLSLELESQDVTDHLAHGDMLGACVENEIITTAGRTAIVERSIGDTKITVLPNPSTSYFTLQIGGSETAARNNLRVIDIAGRIIEQRINIQSNQTLQFGSHYHRGVYFVEVSNGTSKTIFKLIKQ